VWRVHHYNSRAGPTAAHRESMSNAQGADTSQRVSKVMRNDEQPVGASSTDDAPTTNDAPATNVDRSHLDRQSESAAIFAELHDRIVDRLQHIGLSLTLVLQQSGLDNAIAEQLGRVVDELDCAMRDIRTTAFHARAIERIGSRDGQSHKGIRYLVRFEDGVVFAVNRGGHDFYRMGDNQLWAHESGDVLLSARSGEALATRRGRFYFDDPARPPIYYEAE